MSAMRENEIREFLQRCGWGDARRRPIPGDASFRRYERLEGPRGRAVLMDASPDVEDVRPFVRIARHLIAVGLSAPTILAGDVTRGFLLLEDLGDDLYNRILDTGADEGLLYRAAVEALAQLHRTPVPEDLPSYSDDLFLFEVSLVTDWFMPLAGLEISRAGRDDFLALWRDLLPLARKVPACVVLRDYHADNLLWLPARDGVARVGQLDFQDAVAGPVTYDIVSLLEDVRRSISPETVEMCRARYLDLMPHIDRDTFATSATIMAAQRNLKIAGIFSRLLGRDGKAAYQRFMPRTWALVTDSLASHHLAPLAAWLDRWIPPQARRGVA